MARLPIKITARPGVGVCLTFGDGIQAWIYAKADPHTARIAKQPTLEEASERATDIARTLTEAWSAEE